MAVINQILCLKVEVDSRKVVTLVKQNLLLDSITKENEKRYLFTFFGAC